jgi:hypothetical protein
MRPTAPDRSRISMNDAHEVRYWTEALDCNEDELAASVARVGISPDAGASFTDIGHTGHSDETVRLGQQRD